MRPHTRFHHSFARFGKRVGLGSCHLPALALALFALAAAAPAQSTFFEVEPNDTKADATPAFGMQPGDFVSADNCGSTHHDVFRVRPAAQAPGIWRQRLVPTNTLFAAFPTLLGRSQFGGVIDPASTIVVQEASPGTTPDRFVQWYGFGAAEEMYVDLVVAATCRVSYTMELQSTPVTPTPVTVNVQPGSGIYMAPAFTSPTFDLDFIVLDGDFDVLPGSGVRRSIYTAEPSGGASASEGVYYVGVSRGPMIVADPANPEDFADSDPTLDFRGAVLSGEVDAGASFRLDVSGASAPVTGTFSDPFEIVWYELRVGTGQNVATFCPGDGSAGACACGTSPVGQGTGCVNSTGRGGHLTAHGSLGIWDVRYDLADLPADSLAILFAGLSTSPGSPSYGGNLCLGPGAIRVGPIPIDGLGRGRVDAAIPFQNAGFVAGTTVYAQALYRDALAPSGCEANATNGEALTIAP